MTAHINIGSNLGDSHALIEQAAAGIALLASGGTTMRRSGFIESEPWGFESPHRFINLGIEIRELKFLEPMFFGHIPNHIYIHINAAVRTRIAR